MSIEIAFEDQGSKARYVAHVPGRQGRGALTVSKTSDALWIADHTQVDGALRGAGVARALAERLIADARAAGRKILPLCPYLRGEAARRPDWADVIQG